MWRLYISPYYRDIKMCSWGISTLFFGRFFCVEKSEVKKILLIFVGVSNDYVKVPQNV